MIDELTDKGKVWRRFNDLMTERKTKYDPIYKEIREFIHPARGEFDNELANDGRRKDKRLIDQTARRVSNVLGAGMQGGLTSKSQEWFSLTLRDKELADYKPVREYLDEIKTRLYQVLERSNFYQAMFGCYQELGTFSTAPVIMLDDDKRVLRCRSFTVGEYALAQNEGHEINTFARYIKMTVPQVVECFGKENASTRVQELYDRGKYTETVTVMNIIEPNDMYLPGKINAVKKPYRSLYWEEGCDDKDKFLRISGYEEFPVMAGRWNVIGSRIYGEDGPGHNALGESKSLQVMQKDLLTAIELQIKPPVLVPDNLQVNMFPGGMTVFNAQQEQLAVKPLFEMEPNVKDTEYKIERFQEIIEKCYYYDLFLMASSADKTMTAYEMSVRQQEKLTVLGPVIENVQNDVHRPAISRGLAIMERRGLHPPPPRELVGMNLDDLDIEYTSIFSQAIRMLNKSTSIMEVVGFVNSVAPTAPEVLDIVNFDEAVNEFAIAKRAPQNIIRSDEEIAAIRENRRKQQEQRQLAELAPVAAQAAQSVKELSEADTAKQSALTNLLGGPVF
ncbi:Bacteriophage head to tail connecting protein [Sporomusa ovata DSM 2662]|uniref:Phage protein n=1 Tax=Sporomusa ovata TaxID=2378 RepID=A0A0U1KWS9_9FIRM|nr:portal protein [Sporomusa ovata]EQB29332.1 bacteriophage head to tail connecting protein [Sporomusa ovata DSM 2662]CQR71373.1 Phage protein [Sporomusa ovata]